VPSDLRKHPCDDALIRVEKTLQTAFDPTTELRKRRSIGFRTIHNTWVRIEMRDFDRIDGQGWGVECAAILEGVSKPAWTQGFSWLDTDLGVMWRADETEYVIDSPIKPGGILTAGPALPASWWMTFNASLTALAGHTTMRVATPGLRPITQARVAETIRGLFPDVDATIDEWAPAHGDLAWSNLTAPNCYLLDWEDWGMAPRGFDAATLWSESLAVTALAEQVYLERRAELDSRSGTLARLYQCSELLAAGLDYAGPLFEPAKAAAAELVNSLR
jgi:hypothetical protein